MDPNRMEEKRQQWDQRMKARQERWQQRQGACGPGWFGGALVGFVFMAFGLLFLLRNLDIIYFDNIWQYWPVILIVIGASKLISPRGTHDIFPGLVIGGIGTFFLLRNLDIIQGSVWGYIWPMILIALGASMLLRHLDGGGTRPFVDGQLGATESDAPKLNVDVVFSGAKRKITSPDFQGGKVAVVGGSEIDLREAGMKREEVTVKADSVFGGIEFRVPEAWYTEVRGNGVFGTVEDRTRKPQILEGAPKPPRLIIRADAVFGSVVARN